MSSSLPIRKIRYLFTMCSCIGKYTSLGCPLASHEFFGRMFTSDRRYNITYFILYLVTCTSSLNSLPILHVHRWMWFYLLSGRFVDMDSRSSSSTIVR
uniref:Uncharacterized protein n=1 Tax=Picea glauca TaxID=3330 RepID=A0A101M0F9_PICGL|nr:hypothetical protein ABT39_MTgene1729 [Picea glauca]KUM48739.1 hypothetical protein ABT39_MTgene4754 [Picea glauca]QHR89619.1 hypothetical protein Q903MT_gene3641 [Picea sitchensis]